MCNWVPSTACPTKHDFAYGMTTTKAKYASEIIFMKDTPHLALTCELWGIFVTLGWKLTVRNTPHSRWLSCYEFLKGKWILYDYPLKYYITSLEWYMRFLFGRFYGGLLDVHSVLLHWYRGCPLIAIVPYPLKTWWIRWQNSHKLFQAVNVLTEMRQ